MSKDWEAKEKLVQGRRRRGWNPEFWAGEGEVGRGDERLDPLKARTRRKTGAGPESAECPARGLHLIL